MSTIFCKLWNSVGCHGIFENAIQFWSVMLHAAASYFNTETQNLNVNQKNCALSGYANRHQLFLCFRVKQSVLRSNRHCTAVQFSCHNNCFFFHLRNKKIQIQKCLIYNANVYILCDMLHLNIVNVLFVEDGNHFYFYSLGGSCCHNFPKCWICAPDPWPLNPTSTAFDAVSRTTTTVPIFK